TGGLVCPSAIVVEAAQIPVRAPAAIGHVWQDGLVLHRNAGLVVETVVHPALDLRLGAQAAVHRDVEGMMDVIAGALRVQLLLKFFFTPGRSYSLIHDRLLRA